MNVLFVGDTLVVTRGMAPASAPKHLASIDALCRMFVAMRAQVLRKHKASQKRDKIRTLQQRGVQAQIDALATRMRFSYALRSMAHKIKLVVRLDDPMALYVDIPLRGAQAVLNQLEDLILRVRDLYACGGRCEMTTPYDGYGRRKLVFQSPP